MRYWLNTIWPPVKGESHDYTSVWAQDRSKKAIELLSSKDCVFLYETKTGPIKKYPFEFCWNDIPGKSGDRFINFLKSNFYINFFEHPSITKSDKDTINLSDGKIAISVKLNIIKELEENWYEMALTINGKLTRLFGEIEEGKLYLSSENKKIRKEGRVGIIAFVKTISKFKEHQWEGPDIYIDRDPIDWKWEAETKIVHVGGFVPQRVVCEILGKSKNYFFRGWGIQEISEMHFLRLLEYYVNHPA